MTEILRIELVSVNPESLEKVSRMFKEIADKMGVRVKGPIPLPTKRLRVTALRNPSGEGTNRYDKYELRIHKRIIDIPNPDERYIRSIMGITLPDDVKISIVLM
ncbi:30S ribosomal protein S10 [Candidatus Korarchaeum cryptofilum]|jgi:small subunit ribosomal protein S10|uniref:Small ribosomal subunit protein uS10 n=1 Tax=Korarchaeum cryptofilum (strain OPF8) TaxID=374847 RepID=RS10_KORCO|nr:30S ribosomal protein S10 [Candidatus Korarchaeum cryptofilum]B1L712.1 RecName: Full=Small ribosomal subunit protein uS10; AltName: Full=30S ribosomal protein S10 [Candidatus Korarchaeum cryptofilum OPF8]ACB08241.1 ribosomal protein S10 [Candidatus Korarchaeum cryptofilum OPF8]